VRPHLGVDRVSVLPVDWLAELELREVVERIALDCVSEVGACEVHPADAAWRSALVVMICALRGE
jgi:hypothetical protein